MKSMQPRSFTQLRTGALLLLIVVVFCGVAQAQGDAVEPAWSNDIVKAPYLLEVFNDYQCPPCGAFNPDLNRVLAAFPGGVRVVYRNYPLRMHQHALAAARAAEAARRQRKFLAMKEMLFERVAEWTVSNHPNRLFRQYARRLKLNRTQFRRDMSSQAVADRIAADKKRGDALGVTGTPTVFLNGTKLRFEDTSFNRISAIIREGLERKWLDLNFRPIQP